MINTLGGNKVSYFQENEIPSLNTLTKKPMDDFKSIFELFGGRKLIVAVLFSIVAVSLAIAGKIDQSQLLEFLTWIYGLYVGANVSQKIGLK